MLGFLVFRPVVYKPLWDTFVGIFELYENLSFLSSLEVLLITTDPYLWISNSKWRIFLTYIAISSKWHEFLLFCNSIDSTSSVFPFVDFRSRGFVPISVQDVFHPQIRDDPSSSGNQSSVSCSSKICFRFSCLWFQNCLWGTHLFTVLVHVLGFYRLSSFILVFVTLRLACFWIGDWKCLFIHNGAMLRYSKLLCPNGHSVVFAGLELPRIVVLGSIVGF